MASSSPRCSVVVVVVATVKCASGCTIDSHLQVASHNLTQEPCWPTCLWFYCLPPHFGAAGWFDIFLVCSFGCSFAPEHLVCTTFRAWLCPLSVYIFSSSSFFILHKLSISVFCILHLYLYLYFRRLRRCCCCCSAHSACLASRFVTVVADAFV